MKAEEYLIENIKEIAETEKIEGLAIRYAYDKGTEFHIIEVAPEEIRRGSEDYMRWESRIWKEFYKHFPDEDIIISAPCYTHNMTNLIYEKNDTGEEMEMICKA